MQGVSLDTAYHMSFPPHFRTGVPELSAFPICVLFTLHYCILNFAVEITNYLSSKISLLYHVLLSYVSSRYNQSVKYLSSTNNCCIRSNIIGIIGKTWTWSNN